MQSHARQSSRRVALRLLAAMLLMAVVAPIVHACNVPVFRYALERWPADPYVFVVFHDSKGTGKLDAETKAILDKLEAKRIDREYNLHLIDVSRGGEAIKPPNHQATESKAPETSPDRKEGGPAAKRDTKAPQPLDKQDRKLLEVAKPKQAPWLYVLYANSYAEDPPAYNGPLSQAVVDGLLNSPARKEIARLILKGESVVWLLLEGGDKQRDGKARQTIEQTLKTLAKELRLPQLDDSDKQYLTENAMTPLKLSFSLVTLSRDNTQEQTFIRLLDGWDPRGETASGGEEGKAKHAPPMLFAIFGRGRVLGPMVGKEIVSDNIEKSGVYLTGACSCQIKRQNPGWDMLMQVNWDAVIQGEYTLAEALPRLSTVGAALQDKAAIDRMTKGIAKRFAADNLDDSALPAGGSGARTGLDHPDDPRQTAASPRSGVGAAGPANAAPDDRVAMANMGFAESGSGGDKAKPAPSQNAASLAQQSPAPTAAFSVKPLLYALAGAVVVVIALSLVIMRKGDAA